MSVLISDAIDERIREWVVAGFSNMVSSAESDVLLEVPAVGFGELRDML